MTQEKQKQDSQKTSSKNQYFLVLHDDDVNTFDFVIDALVEVCNHQDIQAEQCALITHHKGKCDVKKGETSTLEFMKERLLERGLSVTIEA